MSQIELDSALFLAAYSCVSTEETRYYLQGVFVTPAPHPDTGRGVLMVATDGHRMALVWDGDGVTDRGRIIRLDPKAKALKLARGEARRVLHLDGLEKGKSAVAQVMHDHGAFAQSLDVLTVAEIDGVFPDWTRVLPVLPAEGIAVHADNTFAPDYLAGFGKAFKALTGDRSGRFGIAQPEAGSPAWIWHENVPHVRFICMPIKLPNGFARPAFIDLALSGK